MYGERQRRALIKVAESIATEPITQKLSSIAFARSR